MTVTDQIKILDGKIVQNEAQYDLDKKTAEISALSSNNLEKYEYLTGEDLGLKPSTVEQAKFEYSPLGKVFTKGLEKEEAHLKAIEDQGKKELDAIKNINIGSKPLKTIGFFSTITEKAKKLMNKIKTIDDWLDTAQLICTKTDVKTKYDFNKFTFPLKFTSKIYRHDLMLQEPKNCILPGKTLLERLRKLFFRT